MFELLIFIVLAIFIILVLFLILGKFTALDPDKMTSIEDYATANNLNPDDVIKKIRDGQYRGQFIEGKWHIYAPNEDNNNKEKPNSRLDNDLTIPNGDS